MRSADDCHRQTARLYAALRREVSEGNPGLDAAEQTALRSHYPVMMAPGRYPPPLVSEIYVARRAPALAAVAATEAPVVFDAGCGYGSESFFFAALGARVLAVDLDEEKVVIARRRQPYWEEYFERPLEIVWQTADLDRYTPTQGDLSLTWMGSVLAALPDQDGFFRRVHGATRAGGEMMISDMNLLNPLFLFKEWQRRRAGRRRSPAFDRAADYGAMVFRRGRTGARYFPLAEGAGDDPDLVFDDSQFFWPRTLARLFRATGFEPGTPAFSGFMPPIPGLPGQGGLEALLSRLPGLRRFGYFYRMSGFKTGVGVEGDPGR